MGSSRHPVKLPAPLGQLLWMAWQLQSNMHTIGLGWYCVSMTNYQQMHPLDMHIQTNRGVCVCVSLLTLTYYTILHEILATTLIKSILSPQN